MKRYFTTLDGCRGVAAIIIAADHVLPLVGISGSKFGFLGLDFFFMLSGFIIAHAYERRLSSDMGFAAFLKIRVFRLHPLLILGTIIPVALLCATSGETDVQLYALAILGILMVPTSFVDVSTSGSTQDILAFPINGPSWSMFAEYIENAIYGMLAKYLNLYYISAALIVSAILEIALVVHYGTLSVGYMRQMVWLSLIRIQFPFIMGIGINMVYKSGFLSTIRPRPILPVLMLVVILSAPIALPTVAFSLIAVFLIIPLIVIMGVAVEQEQSKQDPVLTFLGTISYPLYVLHMPIMMFAIDPINLISPIGLRFTMVCVALAGLIAISYMITLIYDLPVRGFLMARWGPKKVGWRSQG